MQKTCEKVVAGLQIHLDLGVPAGQLSVAEQQLLQIARAASFRSLRVLILDEPTSALTPSEVGRLFALLRQMRASGVATIFITHRLNEVLELADRVTVLRDGATVGTWPSAATSEELLVRHMVGRATDPVVRLAPSSLSANGMLEVQSLCGDGFEDVSFTVHAGEVLVVFGLVGSGRSEVLRGVFGVEVVRSGRVMVDGHELRKHSVADSVQAGLGMVPEDRKRQGLVGSMSVRENVSLASLRRITKLGFIEKREDRQLAAGFQRELNIQPSDVQTKVTSLSGGNQQKVVIARWLATSPKVLMLDDPTAGVDVGAKAEVHRLIRSIAQGGAAVLLVSSDVREVLSVADRVLVMHEGRVMGIVDLDSATEEKLVALASGVPLAEAG
jgi:ABC-type sugar transport system ATPase subunit